MKRFILILFVGALLAAPCFSQTVPVGAGLQAAPGRAEAPPLQTEKAAAPTKPIALPDEVRELLNDQRVIAALIDIQEKASGKTEFRFSIADLRQMLQAKQNRVTAWVAANVPSGWNFDATQMAFVPPPVPSKTPSGAEGPAKKP